MAQTLIPAVYMRGGTSKGVFFQASALPQDPVARDQILLRVIGSPDPYGQQIDGMGGATSSTSKVVIISKSEQIDCDVDYLFGAVSIEAPTIDWSGNCGNLTSAVGPYAISAGLVAAVDDGLQLVRIWQANIGKQILAYVPMKGGKVVELGNFELDGVTFPAAEIKLEFLDPGGSEDAASGSMFPTGNLQDTLHVAEIGPVRATLISAGNPTIFVEARTLGLRGNELQDEINSDERLLRICESIRAQGAVLMHVVSSEAEATSLRPHTPKLAFVSAPQDYVASNGRRINRSEIDLTARIFSMGKLHHAMTGTGAVAVAVAAAIPGTIVEEVIGGRSSFGNTARWGHSLAP